MQLEIDTRDFDRVLAPLRGMGRQIELAVRAAVKRAAGTMGKDISAQIRLRSYLKAGDVKKSLTKPVITGNGDNISAEIRVASKPLAMDRYRLLPKRVTARKRKASRFWPEAGYQIGPSEPVRQARRDGGLSKGFVIRRNGRLFLMQRRGKKLERVFGYSVQYFAAFDETVRVVQHNARETFEKRLAHEVRHRLEKLR